MVAKGTTRNIYTLEMGSTQVSLVYRWQSPAYRVIMRFV